MPKDSFEHGRVEPDALQAAVGQVLSRVWDDAKVLESTARAAFDVICELSRGDDGAQLEERAIWLHGLTAHALTVVTRLNFLAGRLAGLADGRTVIESAVTHDEDTGEGKSDRC